MAGEELLDEGSVAVRDHRLDVRLGDPFDLLGRHDDIEAVGLAVGEPVQQVEVAGQLLRVGVADRAEHPQSTGSADGGRDGGERREAEDGVLDAQFSAQLRLHGRQDAAAGQPREEIF
ncbi:hypothetical protein Smic_82280 [Streptomyces microflavus]|uniref:Uncharacterized protein n=1 Tax=Streptomyces microflavus TaxID=1919 RepID=A0A7J0D4L6_STRMI|nr:hypothetical protein Smic_82280 [Streptomyces microflavus]